MKFKKKNETSQKKYIKKKIRKSYLANVTKSLFILSDSYSFTSCTLFLQIEVPKK